MGGPPLSMLPSILASQYRQLPRPTTSFANRTVIVTGSNVGLGKEAARHIARLSASRLILAVRDSSKGDAARQEILESLSSAAPDVQVEVWSLDLSSYASVLSFCERANNELVRLDVLLLNAGIATTIYRAAEDNEATITVNVVSTFLLALLLLPKMRQTAKTYDTRPNLTVTSSIVHFFTSFEEKSAPEGQIFETLNRKDTANMADRYSVSKLLEVFVIREMATRRPDDLVTFSCMNPALCESELFRDNMSFMMKVQLKLVARTAEEGSRCLVHAASAGKETHGQYLSDCKVHKAAPLVTSEVGMKTQKRVFEELMAKLNKIKPDVAENL